MFVFFTMEYPSRCALLLSIWISFCARTEQFQDVPPVVLGDFESLPGGRGNIAEFGKALRLPSSLAEKNIVQFYKDGNIYYHRFLFHNSSHILYFPFTFGDTMTIQIHEKTIEYSYILETTNDPYRATIFARYEEQNGMMRFTVEAVFTRSGMVSTYTHADVLDSIMARRTYRRIVPQSALGYYENVPDQESKNFKEFAAPLPTPIGASYGPNNKIYFGQSSRQFMLKMLLDPESAQITYPFMVGQKQRKFIAGKQYEYMVDVEKGDFPNITIIRAQFREENADLSYMSEFVINGKSITATYKRNNVIATRVFKRSLPLHFYGTYVAVTDGDQNYAEFDSIFQDSSVGVAESATKLKFYRQGETYHQEITNIFGMTESVNIPFQLDAHTEQDVLGKPYHLWYHYEGGEKPTLHVHFDNVGGEHSFTVNYTFSGSGIMALYERKSTILGDPITAKRFYRRQLPTIIFGRYESIDNTDAFKSFANGIFFPELTSKTTIEFLERNGTYVQKFTYAPGVKATLHEIPFVLGENHEQLVKEKWMIEYTYNAWEGDRTFLISLFGEKRNGTNAVSFGDFSRVADFTKEGFTSVYTVGNITIKRTYKRLP